jgi:hypothetical protein
LLDYFNTASSPQPDGGSGSPFFLVFTNSVGQTQFVYFGHLVTASDLIDGVYYGAVGPSYKHYYNAIREAVNTLNASSQGGNGRNLQPITVTDTEWSSSLMNGLVSYWKMNETSGTRLASHGSYILGMGGGPGTPIGSTYGYVYPIAADLFVENNRYFLVYGEPDFGFPGSITISVWFLLRDYSPLFSALVTKDRVAFSSRDWAIDHNNGYLRFYINGDGATVVQSPFIEAGYWHHALVW